MQEFSRVTKERSASQEPQRRKIKTVHPVYKETHSHTHTHPPSYKMSRVCARQRKRKFRVSRQLARIFVDVQTRTRQRVRKQTSMATLWLLFRDRGLTIESRVGEPPIGSDFHFSQVSDSGCKRFLGLNFADSLRVPRKNPIYGLFFGVLALGRRRLPVGTLIFYRYYQTISATLQLLFPPFISRLRVFNEIYGKRSWNNCCEIFMVRVGYTDE